MRSGACTVQQTLTTEAASVLKHSLSLARRRGHAQVTPLHVAATLLSSRASLLRRACLKSQPQTSHTHHHHHTLQCRALELCFNVALNRLPTTPSPLLHAQPSLSNALIAALKRAQAHQRRGCIEQQQQQPLLTIKVELEQLIISILDDPSVSRVMREAGFSSTAVKNNIEDCSPSSVFQYCYSATSTGGVFSSPSSPSPAESRPTAASFWQTHFLTYSSEKNPLVFSPQKKILTNNFTDSLISVKEDIKLVLQVLLRNKRKNTVIVGDSVFITEGLVGELMGKVERGEVPMEMKQVQFVKFQFAPVSLRFMKKEDVELNISQLKRKVETIVSGGEGEGGAIIYTGDLKWTVEEDQTSGSNVGNGVGGYSPVEHLVEEIGKIVSSSENKKTKVWLMGTASYQTYMRCQMRQPPLEIQWALQPVSVPSAGLALSLHASSVHESRISFSQNPSQAVETKPLIISNSNDNELSCCPECTSNYENEAQVLLKSGHNKNLPPWLHPQPTNANNNQKDELVELRRKWNGSCRLNHHLGSITNLHNNNNNNQSFSYSSLWPTQNNHHLFQDSNSISLVPKFRRQQSCTIDFNFDINGRTQKQPNLDSLKNTQGTEVKITLALGNSFLLSDIGEMDLYKLLQDNVPWQSQTIIYSIAQALLQSQSTTKGTCFLLLQGNDILGKRRLALAIAESVLGSADLLLYMNMRKTDNEAITRALRHQEKRVVALVEDVDFADSQLVKLLETENFGESVIILTRDGDFMRYQDQDSVIQMMLEVKETKPARFGTPNMDHKRKLSEWEDISSTKTRNPRKDLSRRSSFNTSILDLNIKANEDDQSPISSDLTLEITSNPVTPNGFLDSIKNRFVFDRNQDQDREITEIFSSKMKKCFEEVFGDQNMIVFSIENRVLEGVVDGYGCFVNSQMERWLKDIFQNSLETVKIGRKEGVGVRLCFEGRNDRVLENGFMGTCLPKKIQVSFIN